MMRTNTKKAIVYLVALVYLALSASLLFFESDIHISNTFLSTAFVVLMMPGAMITFVFGFFGGKAWAFVGMIITVLLTILFIERLFKTRR